MQARRAMEAVSTGRPSLEERERSVAFREAREEREDLSDLLSETRILLLSSQVFLAFLAAVPFMDRFVTLGRLERHVYLCTFVSALLAFACFVTPAAYHRIARPIHHKERFKRFASSVLVVGLVPTSTAMVLVTFLVGSVAVGRTYAFVGAALIAGIVVGLWWFVPLRRIHDRLGDDPPELRPSDTP